MKRKVKNSKGFTLVETVAAITILTLVVAAVTASLIASIRFNAKTEQRLQAELAVSNAVERLMAEGWDGSSDVSGVSITASTEDVVTLKDEDDNDIDVVVGYFVTVSSANPNVSTISVTAYVPAKEAP